MTTETTETHIISRGDGTVTVKVTYTPRTGKPIRLYRLKIEVVETTNDLSKKIFIYQRATNGAPMEDGTPRDEFIGIADELDEDEIPVDEPDFTANKPYYRVSDMELLFRNADMMYESANTLLTSIKTR